MSKKRIVVTGLGVVSSLGQDVEKFYSSLLKGESGISKISKFSVEGYPTQIAGAVRDFNTDGYVDKKLARRADDCILYGLVAGKKAMESAGLDEETRQNLDLTRCGAILGSGMGGMDTFTDNLNALNNRGYKRVSPFFIPYVITNMPGALLAIDYGFMGPNYSVSTACATGNYALVSAANHIRNGDADLMVCGGVEAALCDVALAGFIAVKALSTRNDEPTKASRPWDQGRDGFVMGEGAGVLVLESLEHALERGAPIYAEYLGGALSCDAYHMTAPHENGDGILQAIENGLKNADIGRERVNHVNCHATSTPLGDMGELAATARAFPDQQVCINSTKSMIGHCLGAAAGIEAVATVMACHTGKVHPTINLEDPEEGCAPFHVPTKAEDFQIDVAMSSSFGFGGHNATVFFTPYSE